MNIGGVFDESLGTFRSSFTVHSKTNLVKTPKKNFMAKIKSNTGLNGRTSSLLFN